MAKAKKRPGPTPGNSSVDPLDIKWRTKDVTLTKGAFEVRVHLHGHGPEEASMSFVFYESGKIIGTHRHTAISGVESIRDLTQNGYLLTYKPLPKDVDPT